MKVAFRKTGRDANARAHRIGCANIHLTVSSRFLVSGRIPGSRRFSQVLPAHIHNYPLGLKHQHPQPLHV